jgi:hypothetical protein
MPEFHGRPPGRRTLPNLTAVIKGKESAATFWTESAELTSLSRNAAGFFLPRSCTAGRLLSLMLPMPEHLRCYDQDKKLYRIWGLVQHCYESAEDENDGYHIGVAFVGKEAPESYYRNPTQCYRVTGLGKNGLWRIDEFESMFVTRKSLRSWTPIDASIFLLDKDLKTIADDEVKTENISTTGVSVFSTLLVKVGDRVRFKSRNPAFATVAIVRNRRIGPDNRTRIHLEFVEEDFPVLEIESKGKIGRIG